MGLKKTVPSYLRYAGKNRSGNYALNYSKCQDLNERISI